MFYCIPIRARVYDVRGMSGAAPSSNPAFKENVELFCLTGILNAGSFEVSPFMDQNVATIFISPGFAGKRQHPSWVYSLREFGTLELAAKTGM